MTIKINNHTSRTAKKVFDQFSSGGDYAFSKTVVPVDLAQYDESGLVSRSEAKRLLSRVERFKVVVLAFAGVKTIGQAFADEVFRVFSIAHPGTSIQYVNEIQKVRYMILRALIHES